jgi:hypothetical protein
MVQTLFHRALPTPPIKLLTIQDPLEVSKLSIVHGSKPHPNAVTVPSSKEQVPSGSKVISTITAKVVDVTLLVHRRCLLEATTSSLVMHPSLDKGTMNNRWRGRRFAPDPEALKRTKPPYSIHFTNSSNGKTRLDKLSLKSSKTKSNRTTTGIGCLSILSSDRRTEHRQQHAAWEKVSPYIKISISFSLLFSSFIFCILKK